MEHLGFRLYGNLAAWGDVAVGEHRPSWSWPTKSAVTGIVAASLGIRRDEEPRLHDLADGLGLAIRVESAGVPMTDYHTAQAPPDKARWSRNAPWQTRRDQLSSGALSTVLSSREYVCDFMCSVVVWRRGDAAPTLTDIQSALKCPGFVAYLGRKSNPLCLPMLPQLVEARSLREAFGQLSFPVERGLEPAPDHEIHVYWDPDHPNPDYDMVRKHTRRDFPIARTRWLFDVREECVGVDAHRGSEEE